MGVGIVDVADLVRWLRSVDGAIVLQLPDFGAVGGEAGGKRKEHVGGTVLVVTGYVVEDEIQAGVGGDGGYVEEHAKRVGAVGRLRWIPLRARVQRAIPGVELPSGVVAGGAAVVNADCGWRNRGAGHTAGHTDEGGHPSEKKTGVEESRAAALRRVSHILLRGWGSRTAGRSDLGFTRILARWSTECVNGMRTRGWAELRL